MSKAEKLLNLIEDVTPGKYVTWPAYDGTDILDAKTVEDYVTPFFKTGSLMPIPILNLGLNVYIVQTEYNDDLQTYKVIVEGVIMKLKK
jgi:hypothetical protein